MIRLIAVVAVAYVALIVVISQTIVSPPRIRVSESARPVLGVVIEQEASGEVVIARSVEPASLAGLRGGDVLQSIEGEPVRLLADLPRALRGRSDGEMVRVEARRTDAQGASVPVLVDVPVAIRTVSPADGGLPFQDVAFNDGEGHLLRGWFIPSLRSGRSAALVYAHGNGTDRRHWLSSAWDLHRCGVAQLLFDLPGRGDSEGKTITLGPQEGAAVRAALDVVASRPDVDPSRLAIAGRSMGAVAAILAADGDPRVRALVLDSPYTTLQAVLDHNLRDRGIPPALIRGPLLAIVALRARFEPGDVRPVDVLGRARIPVLLIHGDRDAVVPIEHARTFASASSTVTLVELPGLGHNDARPDDLERTMCEFLSDPLALGADRIARGDPSP